MTKLKAFFLVALMAAVFLALQFGPAAAQDSDKDDIPAGATTDVTYIPTGSEVDYSCTPGPTGHCTVVVVLVPWDEEQKCGEDDCSARIEYRW